jgi:hypothetical protein
MIRYEAWLRERLAKEPEFRQRLLKLDGHELVCYCKPRPCHGDILIKLIEELKDVIHPSEDAAVIGAGKGRPVAARLPHSPNPLITTQSGSLGGNSRCLAGP